MVPDTPGESTPHVGIGPKGHGGGTSRAASELPSYAVPTFYELLEVDSQATNAQIEDAFHRVIKRWHPDRNLSPEAAKRTQELLRARAVLSDPLSRRRYDLGLRPEAAGEAQHLVAPPHLIFVERRLRLRRWRRAYVSLARLVTERRSVKRRPL